MKIEWGSNMAVKNLVIRHRWTLTHFVLPLLAMTIYGFATNDWILGVLGLVMLGACMAGYIQLYSK